MRAATLLPCPCCRLPGRPRGGPPAGEAAWRETAAGRLVTGRYEKGVVRGGEIKALTGLRILAAAWVVLFHFRPLLHNAAPQFSQALSPVLNCGAQGVDLFF